MTAARNASGPPEAPLPHAFEARMRRLLGGEEADALLAALARPAATGLRVNPSRMDLARLARVTGWRLTPLPWCADAAILDAGADRPGLHPLHEAGAYYLQEPSATAPAAALAVRPGERVIDLAAAPGGKATALASALRGQGLLVANDVHPKRVQALARNLERWGARRTLITHEEPARLAAHWRGAVDAVLLDAPCSGEGMFRKSEEARAGWSEASVLSCASRQADLLDAAADLLAPGGRLVYSTCTFSPEENEQVVADLLARRPELASDPFELPGLERGRADWIAGTAGAGASVGLAEASARAWPHRIPGEGHFVARVRRVADPSDAGGADGAPGGAAPSAREGGRAAGRAGRKRRPDASDATPEEARAAWRAFRGDALAPGAFAGTDEALVLRGETLWWPSGAGDVRALRVLRDGLPLGLWRKGRFEPSHALAQALAPGDAAATVELDAEDPALAAYLAGHELDADAVPLRARGGGADRWILVSVHGAPLGWLRRSGPRLRNLYPRGLRRA